MAIYSKNEINQIIRSTRACCPEWKNKFLRDVAEQDRSVGYFMPKGANWAYQIFVILVEGQLWDVVTKASKILTDEV